MVDFTTSKTTGSKVQPAEWNQLADIDQLVIDSGQTPSTGTLDQISKSAAHFAAVSTFYSESGAADAYVLTAISPFKAPTSYQNGMLVRFRASNTNTGASTVNPSGLGAKSIKLYDGTTDPAPGDISTVVDTVLRFDSANDCFVKNEIFIPQASGVAYFNNGIRLSSSSSAVLDEYEEGTFTPTLYGSSTPGSPTYSQQFGRYTRVGRFVFLTIRVIWTDLGGAVGAMRIGALPFTVLSAQENRAAISMAYYNGLSLPAGTTLGGYASPGDTYVLLLNISNTTMNDATDETELTSAGELYITCSYNI